MTYRPTITEYEATGAKSPMFDLDVAVPVFHAQRVVHSTVGLLVRNNVTACGRGTRSGTVHRATFMPLRHARLFGRPCARCFRPPETTP